MKIVLHVDRLVLDGIELEAAGAPRVRAAVERELTRLFASAPEARRFSGGAVPRIAAPDVRVAHRESPGALGRSIGAAVHAGLTQGLTERRK